jgi:GGDEF domain-containing protein
MMSDTLTPAFANGRTAYDLRQTLAQLNAINACLADSGGSPDWQELLRLVAALAHVEAAAFFLGETDRARLLATWNSPDPGTPCPDFSELHEIAYDAYPVLAGTLRMGMVVGRDLMDLPSAEYGLFGRCGFSGLVTLPLIAGHALVGFIALLSMRTGLELEPETLTAINAASRALALALGQNALRVERDTLRERMEALTLTGAAVAVEFTPEGSVVGMWGSVEPRRLLCRGNPDESILGDALAPEFQRVLLLAGPRALAVAAGADTEFSMRDGPRERTFSVKLIAIPCTRRPGRRNIMALVREITAARHGDEALSALTSQLDLVAEAVLLLAPDGTLLRANPAWRALLPDHAHAARFSDCVHPGDRALLAGIIGALTTSVRSAETTHLRLGGPGAWLSARVRFRTNRSTQGYVETISAILDAPTTPATAGFAPCGNSEAAVREAIRQCVARARRNRGAALVAFGRIEGVERIRGTLGPRSAQTLADSVARRLRDALRGADAVILCGDSEFALAAGDLARERAAAPLTRRLITAVRLPIPLDGVDVAPEVRFGFASYPDDAEDPEGLLSAARGRVFEAG